MTSSTLWYDAQRREQCNFSDNRGQIAQTQSNHLKTSDKPQTERQFGKKKKITIFQKSEGHQRHTETDKLSQSEGDQEDVTTKWELGSKNDVSGTTGEIQMCYIVNSIVLIIVRIVGKKTVGILCTIYANFAEGA